MVKLKFYLSIFCFILWNCVADECFTYYNIEPKIALGEKVFVCASLYYKNIREELRFHLTFEDLGSKAPINLLLSRIGFGMVCSNKIYKIADWFHAMPNLYVKYLLLQRIEMSQLADYAFKGKVFTKLERLDIDSLPLTYLKKTPFIGLKYLRNLQLTQLPLKNLVGNALEGMPKLEVFSMISCGRRKLKLDALFGCNPLRLKEIWIENCNLSETITANTFSGLRNITVLTLISNKITTIEPKTFDGIFLTLKKLSLGWNQLKSVPADLFNINRKVSIDLQSNPWHCDCKMEKLRLFTQSITGVQFNGLICNTPDVYDGVEIRNCPSFCHTQMTENNEHKTEKLNESSSLEGNDRWKDKTQMACDISDSLQMIELTKPSHKISPVSRNMDDILYIDTELLSNDFKLIEFHENLFDNEKTCTSHFKDNEIGDIKFKRKLEPNILHRFCWMNAESMKIKPLDCATFYSSSNEESELQLESERDDLDAWIMKSDEHIWILVFVFVAIFAPFGGILIAIILAKLFSRIIRGENAPTKQKVVTKDLQVINSEKKAISNNPRPATCYRQRRFEAEDINENHTALNQTASTSPICQNFRVRQMFMDVTFYDDAPPLPPRNKPANIRNRVN